MQSPVLEFDKNCTQNAYFLQKVDFCIFEPQNRERIENSSKTPINFSLLQCTYLGKNSFQYHWGLVRIKEIEKRLLRTSVQCIFVIFQGGGGVQTPCFLPLDPPMYKSYFYKGSISFCHCRLSHPDVTLCTHCKT